MLSAQLEAGVRDLGSLGRQDDFYSSKGLSLFWPKPSRSPAAEEPSVDTAAAQ